ncbi:DUF4430 domain-containing protein [Paenibacillus pinihumi]|uniref:DUF4430 domain-containing protein n=1 Tax=Paenibacillus pinihumi TaxID=669462 RepID=UPI0004274159|nr:DUF4430 domain-containing protein [Paenibacillus pinihumi]
MKTNVWKKTLALWFSLLLLISVAQPALVATASANSAQAASISVQVRIEGWNQTVIPLKQIAIAPYDITNVVGNNSVGNWHQTNSTPLVIHAILKAMELEGYDVTDEDAIDVGYGGNYIRGIAGEWEIDQGPNSGWMYKVNGVLPLLGVGQQTLQANDLLEVFYIGDYSTYDFGKITASSTSVRTGQSVTFTVSGQPSSWGTPLPFAPISGATLSINGSPTTYTTNTSGQATITFSTPGTYKITANKFGSNSYNLVRPIPVVIQVN